MILDIPNDLGHPYRLNKFVEYQHKVPPIHPVTCVEYVRRNDVSANDCILLSWLVSVTYCEITAIFLYEELPRHIRNLKVLGRFWEDNKPNLIFGSARKHAKNMDWFVPLLKDFDKLKDLIDWADEDEDPVTTYSNILKQVRQIKYVGRFAADLFMEMLVAFSKAGQIALELQEPDNLDWRNCSNLTSGLFNILYMDEEADLYDKTKRIDKKHLPLLDKRIRQVQKAVGKQYPNQDNSLPLIIGKICSFRNLFKGKRYGGFHHDRQLECLIKYIKAYPDKYELWAELYKIRYKLFDDNLLGEIGGWTGVRKERNKLWIQEGLTGVESIGEY